MPTLEVLETLKQRINELGDEPRLLEERGESLGDITPAASPVDSDLEQLLNDENSGGGIDEMEALLGSYVDDLGEAGEEEEGDSSFDDFNLDNLDLPEEIDETEEMEGLDNPGESEIDDFSLDDFNLDDEAVEDFQLDNELPADDMTEEPAEIPAEEPIEELDEQDDENPAEDGGLSLEDLDLDTDTEDLGNLEDLGELDDLDGDVEDDGLIDIPDVESAVDNLGDLDSLDTESPDSLSLDEELNFEEELGSDVLSDISDLDDDSQQFSMDDFGDQYNFKEGDVTYSGDLSVDLDQLEQSLDEASEDDEKLFTIDEEDFNTIRQTLASLPRNLKIALEELLADERRSPEDLKPIIDALIVGETPKSLAARFKTLTKRKIDLPRSYEKRSGLALEARRTSLVYQLIREGWPVIRIVLLVISITWVLGASIFMWVYRPLKANQLYQLGLDAVKVDDVDKAKEYFYDAWDGWPLFYSEEKDQDRIADSPIVVKGWKTDNEWLLYARAFRRRKQWDTAMQFYEGYLSIKPGSKDVRLEYSRFLSGVLGKYQEAFNLIESAPVAGRLEWDRDYTLAAGDVLLDWAEDDPTKYEDARKRYAKVLELSRNDERAVLSMMRYHLRLKDSDEIERLLPIFDKEIAGRTDSPQLASEVFAGLGNYQLAKSNEKEARRFIDLAITANPQSPEASFMDAMFLRQVEDEHKELSAYKRTLVNLEGRESLTRRNLEIRILTLGGMGRVHALNRDFTDAASSYYKSVSLYEDARSRNQLGADPAFGQIYLDLGNLKYVGIESGGKSSDLQLSLASNRELVKKGSDRYAELDLADYYFTEAQKLFNGSRRRMGLPTGSLYRRGYARHELGMDDALLDFHRVARLKPDDYEVRIALATVLLESGDFEASRNQYARALDLLDDELRRTGGVLNPLDKQSHSELLLRYIIAWNNLGVGRARSAARGGGEGDYAAALSAFTMASEYLDEVYEDMPDVISRGASAVRSIDGERIVKDVNGLKLLEESTTIPYLNRMRLLGLEEAPEGTDLYMLYPDIPSDLHSN